MVPPTAPGYCGPALALGTSTTKASAKENTMRKSLLSIAAATALIAGAGIASAQTTTTTTSSWTNDQGSQIQEYSTTKHYSSIDDPTMHVTVGSALPEAVTVYDLPDTMKMPDRDNYSYTIINHHPVVVERSTRKVVHEWDQ
jgi:hypothetical protein